jgi:hypothetical protein
MAIARAHSGSIAYDSGHMALKVHRSTAEMKGEDDSSGRGRSVLAGDERESPGASRLPGDDGL